MSPASVRNLESQTRESNAWRVIGPQAAFFLKSNRARFPNGWARLSIELRVEESDSALAWLHSDRGAGFTQADRIPIRLAGNGRIDEIIKLPEKVYGLRLDPAKDECRVVLGKVDIQEYSWNEAHLWKLLDYCRGEALSPMLALRAAIVQARIFGLTGLISWIKGYMHGENPATTYGPWAVDCDRIIQSKIVGLRKRGEALRVKPKFSILMPVYDTQVRWLEQAIDSVRGQSYEEWELCICDNGSTENGTVALLARYQEMDSRIKVVRRNKNAHISAATNDAMALLPRPTSVSWTAMT